MPFLKKVFGKSDGGSKSKKKIAETATNGHAQPPKPQWTDAWTRTTIYPEEVAELIRSCTAELKARALNIPFLLLPFRPTSDPSAARTFVRNYFNPNSGQQLRGEYLLQEMRLTEPMVLASVIKWCWSRLPGGVITWDAYELFKVGEQDSNYARDAFSTFIPISVDSDARSRIIFDFFDLLSAVAAHGKTNGLGGRKLSRYAGWWAFEHADSGKGFDTGYQSWERAADATSHLFFAYLRSLSPESSRETKGILKLPLSLQSLLQQTEYPPQPPTLMFNETTKVVMIVDTVSPTPFSLLRRVKNFEYRASDRDLQEFSQYEDPVQALTDECRRVLRSISSSNQSNVSKASESTGLKDASWSRFQDIGFGAAIDEPENDTNADLPTLSNRNRPTALKRSPNSETNDLGRPTTPSWADFLSTGFVDENGQKAPSSLLLPPDKVLPPIATTNQRGHSSQSHRRNLEAEPDLEPGELASITKLDLDDSFWWVWISSLSGEEPIARKAVFGRCALLETIIPGGKWLVMEEQVKGALAAQPAPGAYIAEKKGFFSFASRKGRVNRRKSAIKKMDPPYIATQTAPSSKVNIGPDQHARIQAAAAALQKKERQQRERQQTPEPGVRRGRSDDEAATKTTSVMTLQPVIMREASPAMKWASQYDKAAIRAKYLGDKFAGRGASTELLTLPEGGLAQNGSAVSINSGERSPKPPPKDDPARQNKRPITPPPPPEVTVGAQPANEEAQQASEVPLPAEQPIPETPAKDQRLASEALPRISPEQKEHRKLQKKKQPGLKGIFGSKKVPPTQPRSPKSPPDSKAAVAAARAALEGQSGTAADNNLSPTEPAPKSNRFGMRAAHRAAQIHEKPTPHSPVVDEERTPTAENFSERPVNGREEEYDQLSRVDTAEREHADREFSKFDQGPLTEQPAFIPRESPELYEAPNPLEQAVPQHAVSPPPLPGALPEEDEDSEGTEISRLQQPPSPPDAAGTQVQDRWAQIRKNAAERAARQSEEQSRNTDRTDDGETSGEETIESRVARIKARVAELTGNMEQARR